MRKKAQETLIGLFVILCILGWVMQKLGGVWFLVLFVCLAVVIIIYKVSSHSLPKYPLDDFGPLFPTTRDASRYYSMLARSNPTKAARLRQQQILRESLEIAMSSKKRQTAENRMALALETYNELKSSYRIPKKEMEGIEGAFNRAMEKYATLRYINEANGYLARIDKLKTEKSKKKYLDLAKDTIKAGLKDPNSDKVELKKFMDRIPSEQISIAGPVERSVARLNLKGQGAYAVDIVGESYYQDALESICGGRTKEGVDKEVQATLVHEDDNPYDDKAIRVDVEGKAVGHLSRQLARQYRAKLAKAGHPGVAVTCPARIVGGWDRGRGDKGHFGVKLDLPIKN